MSRIETIAAMLQKSPGDSFLQHALALEYIKLGDDARAQQIFETILQQDPAYVGSYYHLAKLLERNNERDLAVNWYEKGMAVAKAAGDGHALNELRAAYENLVD